MSRALVDLDPRFVTDGDSRRVGVSFWCPKCLDHRVSVMVEPPFDPGPGQPHPWKRTGATFADLTLTPSVVAYRGGAVEPRGECWHGFVTNGVLTP